MPRTLTALITGAAMLAVFAGVLHAIGGLS